jgi:hypothetical protein
MIARHAYRSIETGMSFLFRCGIAISCTVVSAEQTGFCTDVAGIPVNYDQVTRRRREDVVRKTAAAQDTVAGAFSC